MKKFILLIFACVFVSCDSPQECRQKATKMGVDSDLCNTFDNRQKISQKYREWSVVKIDAPKQISQKSECVCECPPCSEELDRCKQRVINLEGMLLDREPGLNGGRIPPNELTPNSWKE